MRGEGIGPNSFKMVDSQLSHVYRMSIAIFLWQYKFKDCAKPTILTYIRFINIFHK